MSVDRPMFILGPPRSGTTLLYRCVGSHPRVSYFNRANRKFVSSPRLAWFLTRLGLYRDKPRESHRIWWRFNDRSDHYCLTAADATAEMKAWFHRTIAGVLAARGADRFVAKLPSHALMIPWLKELFPDALFVVCRRDWRAVVGSTVIKRRKDVDWFGNKARGWQEVWDAPPEIGAAWAYVKTFEAIEGEAREQPDRFHEIWYEGLCAAPAATMEDLSRFCGLPWDAAARAAFPDDIRPPSEKWRTTGVPSPEMIQDIRAEFGEVMRRFEYSPPG